jgi:hypothetical protein
MGKFATIVCVAVLAGCGTAEDEVVGAAGAEPVQQIASVHGRLPLPAPELAAVCEPGPLEVSGAATAGGAAIDFTGAVADVSLRHPTRGWCAGRPAAVTVGLSFRNGECYVWLAMRDGVLEDGVLDVRGCPGLEGIADGGPYFRLGAERVYWPVGLPRAAAAACVSVDLTFPEREVVFRRPSDGAEIAVGLAGLRLQGDVTSAGDAKLACPPTVGL